MDNQDKETSSPLDAVTRPPDRGSDDIIWDEILQQLKTDSGEQPQARRRFEAGGQ